MQRYFLAWAAFFIASWFGDHFGDSITSFLVSLNRDDVFEGGVVNYQLYGFYREAGSTTGYGVGALAVVFGYWLAVRLGVFGLGDAARAEVAR